MAQIKLLKIAADGLPIEMNTSADDITLASFSVTGGGPSISATGLAMANQDITGIQDLVFQNPATGTINQTAGVLVSDNIMAKERSNTMTVAGDILFPVVTDTAGQIDAFRLPAIAGTPTATPTAGGEGYLVWDSTNNKLYAWDGAVWDDLTTATSANHTLDVFTAGEILAAKDVVYISAADTVSKALGDSTSKSFAMGLSKAAAAAAASVNVQFDGLMSGFSLLTAGARYYLDATTAGAITSTIPTGSGNTIVQVGYAKSASVLDIMIQQLGRRA